MIGGRRSDILYLIIEQYLKTGEPIGSKTLSGLLPYSVSSATIRNEMARLSELGFLEQLHTSGGRIPSRESYRYYVDHLMKPNPVTSYEAEKIRELLSVNAGDPERLLADAAQLLADLTRCAAFYSTAEDSLDCVQGVELIPAGNSKAMLVMLTVGGRIKSSLCKVDCPIGREFKNAFYTIINDFFIGTELSNVNLSLIQSTAVLLGEKIFDMLPVLTSLCSLCHEAAGGSLVIAGETNLLSHKDLGEGVYRLLSFLANRSQFMRLLNRFPLSTQTVMLFIGDENPHHELKNSTMILARYSYNNDQKATLGLIGSTNIDYPTVIPRTEYVADAVSGFLS